MTYVLIGLGVGCLIGGAGSIIAIRRNPTANDRVPLCIASAATLIGAWTLTLLAIAP